MESEVVQAIDSVTNSIDALARPRFIDWISVVLSGLAIWFAIQVPKKIADRQDKIALFEKRYAVYETLNHCISFSISIKESYDIKQIHMIFIATFGYDAIIKEQSDQVIHEELTQYITNAKDILDTASFLFTCETSSYILPIISTLFGLLYSSCNPEIIRKYKTEVQRMEQELMPQIKNELSLLR